MKHKHNPEEMPVGMLIHHISRNHMVRIHDRLESFGVQRTYGPILKELSMNEGVTQKELAAEMHITAPSMSVNLQKMENAGLLLRKTDDADMRQIRLYLTDKGKDTAECAEREIAASEEKLAETLTGEEREIFKRLLIKVLDSQIKRGDKF